MVFSRKAENHSNKCKLNVIAGWGNLATYRIYCVDSWTWTQLKCTWVGLWGNAVEKDRHQGDRVSGRSHVGRAYDTMNEMDWLPRSQMWSWTSPWALRLWEAGHPPSHGEPQENIGKCYLLNLTKKMLSFTFLKITGFFFLMKKKKVFPNMMIVFTRSEWF